MAQKAKRRSSATTIRQPPDSNPLSAFFACPKQHKLPHRVKGKGRCSPFDCCEMKGGAHAVVRQHEKQNHAEALAYAEETAKLSEMKDRMNAWNEAHPIPEVPPPPKTNSIREYMTKRMEQIAPLALERRIRVALLDPGHQGEVAARELLNRGGFTERPEVHTTFSGPVFIVGDAAQIAAQSPYAAQGKLSDRSRTEVVDGSITVEGDDERGQGSFARGPADAVALGEVAQHRGAAGEEDPGPEAPEGADVAD